MNTSTGSLRIHTSKDLRKFSRQWRNGKPRPPIIVIGFVSRAFSQQGDLRLSGCQAAAPTVELEPMTERSLKANLLFTTTPTTPQTANV
ncbi:hypothetical protein PoB_007350100 [Plakobranchus ocellatus]|uniref:Uncharacterized protein n=1 Tax=Plakobranchus ocellatus TaxID=259542 RepID=A0AAV4DT37_9GAST|nr:hypothetical protein PoB_007350100 [Plakobranchus ocellatus]